MFSASRAFRSASVLARRPSTSYRANLVRNPAFTSFAFARAMSSTPLTDAIKDDHEEMYEYYDNYKKTSNVDEKERWARQLIWEVARHAVGEEIVVYPLMEEHLGQKGKDLADEDRAQHTVVKNLLYNIESLNAGTSEHEETMKKVMDHLKPHNDSEEREDLPALEEKIGPNGSKSAAESFKRTKQFVPTRTHPSVPNQPPYETAFGLMLAPIDKLKDVFAKFPTQEMKDSA